jgi:hypothetical protein
MKLVIHTYLRPSQLHKSFPSVKPTLQPPNCIIFLHSLRINTEVFLLISINYSKCSERKVRDYFFSKLIVTYPTTLTTHIVQENECKSNASAHVVMIYFSTLSVSRLIAWNGRYSWTSEPNRLHHISCRQPCRLKALGLQRGIPYEIFRKRRS